MSGESDASETPDRSAFLDTEDGEHDQGVFLTPENEMEATSARQENTDPNEPPEPAKDAAASCAVHSTPPPSLEILSPRPSPHVPGENIKAVVEDWEDEDDSYDCPDYTPQSSFCVATPPLAEAALSPIVQEKNVKPAKPESYLQDHRDESHQRQRQFSVTPVQQGDQENTSKHRPSVMDYLVSHGPIKYPMSISRSSSSTSRRTSSQEQLWQNNDRRPSHWGQPPILTGYEGESRNQQLGWADQRPAPQNPLNVHDDRNPEASHKRGFSQPWEQIGPQAPSSNISVSNNDNRSGMYTDGYPGLANYLDNMVPSGYHLLATKLSGDSCGQPISPIYRRFDALSHRLLLYMQDEIADLERQLISLEAKDTLKRSYAGGVVPASQRQDRWTDSTLARQKTEVLGLIGYKLSQYNHVLASFCKVQDIPAPTWRDIHMYKSYLATSKLIVDDETRFLDASSDLISLSAQGPSLDDSNTTAEGPTTPMPKTAEEEASESFFRDKGSLQSTRLDRVATSKLSDDLFVRLALSGTCIVLVPIMIFSVIPSFVGRMAIVLLVALGVSITMDQSGLLSNIGQHRRDWIVYFGLYCGAMTVVAGAMN